MTGVYSSYHFPPPFAGLPAFGAENGGRTDTTFASVGRVGGGGGGGGVGGGYKLQKVQQWSRKNPHKSNGKFCNGLG